MKPEELIAEHQWWHQITIRPGVVTPGACPHGQTVEEMRARWAIPDSLGGKTVLDIGCWDGLFSVACLRRNAETVTGLDVVDRPTFKLVRQLMEINPSWMKFRKHDAQISVHSRKDIVLCFGVLYHVERPMEVLRNAVHAALEMVIVETALAAQVGAGDDGVRWVQARGHGGDPTNVWYPTSGAVLDALRAFGCREAFEHFVLPGGSRGTYVGLK